MKRILLGTVSIGALSFVSAGLMGLPLSGAVAAESHDRDYVDGFEALKKDIARLREENAALRERDQLQEENAALRARTPDGAPVATARAAPPPANRAAKPVAYVPQAQPSQARASQAHAPQAAEGRIPLYLPSHPDADSPLSAYAADMPMLKAPPPADKGETKLWVEGGAIWTRGDPFNIFYPNGGGYLRIFGGSGSMPGFFGFKPKLGFEAAGGFDHRISGTPWHVSGEIRYGQGTVSDSLASGASLSIAGVTIATSSSVAGNDKETHALADFAVGRDLGVGKDAVQFKVGIRVAEITANANASLNSSFSISGLATPAPTIGGGTTTSVRVSTLYNNELKSSFRGAGPRIGLEGSAPLWGGFVFDYLADAAALFGTQKSEQTVTSSVAIAPVVIIPIGFGGPSFGPVVTNRPSAVFNADLQMGLGYWINPNLKITASYRFDAFWGALLNFDAAGNSVKVDRYYHGPRLTVTGDF